MGKIGIYNSNNFSLDLDLLFDCSFVLEYAKIRAVLQFGRTYNGWGLITGIGRRERGLMIGAELFKAGLR